MRPAHEWAFVAVGTQWWIGVYQPLSKDLFAQLKRTIGERIERFDATYSRFRPDSWVNHLARQPGTYALPPDARKLFTFYRALYELSGGTITPLIGEAFATEGYTATTPPLWDDVLSVGGQTITVRRPVLLDVGAAGKGFLVDAVGEVLRGQGVTHFCIDAGGDMYCNQLVTDMYIGLEHPADPAFIVGTATLRHGSICASAPSRRAWPGYHQIVNPFTLEPVQSWQAVWVVASNTLTADGLATALFLVPPERLSKHFIFEYCAVDSTNSVQWSPGFPGRPHTT
ncbi:MAG TPA: FAD:protein FMN transferase [Bacillota bacterium]|nr:FAD:protein FMN transferase [Bacillota bacterium]